VTDVAGFGEASVAMLQAAKPPDWDMDLQAICQVRGEALQTARDAVGRDLAARAAEAQPNPLLIGQLRLLQGQIDAYEGRMAAAIARFLEGYAVTISGDPAA